MASIQTEAVSEPDAPAAKVVRVEGVALSDLNIALGSTIEVLWEVECENQEDESVWWAATVEADGDDVGAASLVYVSQHGFEQESRRVTFLSNSYLWDAQLKEQLPYRKEGEEGPPLCEAEGDDDAVHEFDPDVADAERRVAEAGGPLTTGMAVKARFQGGERYHAGTIVEVHPDGTYDVLYEDNVCEQNVPRDVIEVVALAPAVREALQSDDSQTCAESVADFFELFVSALTSSPKFASLPPDKKQIAADKVRSAKPHFEAELAAFREERGWGARVTGEDIKVLVPRVMSRAARAAA